MGLETLFADLIRNRNEPAADLWSPDWGAWAVVHGHPYLRKEDLIPSWIPDNAPFWYPTERGAWLLLVTLDLLLFMHEKPHNKTRALDTTNRFL